MSHTIWMLMEGQESDDWDHSVMLRLEKKKNKLCKANDMPLFSELLDQSVFDAEYSGCAVEPNYQDASALLAVLVPLREEVLNGTGWIRASDRSAVLEELDDCIEKARKAAADGDQIRLVVIP